MSEVFNRAIIECGGIDGFYDSQYEAFCKHNKSCDNDHAYGLTPEQQEVVNVSEGRHLVLAPPGTGKTQMLSERVKRALANGVPPEKMLCGTFTIRAAAEMRDRVMKETGKTEDELPLIGNLHHICHRFLFGNKVLPQCRQVANDAFVEEALITLRKEHPLPDWFLERHYVRKNSSGEPICDRNGNPIINHFKANRDYSDAIQFTLAQKAGTPIEFLKVRHNPCLGTEFVENVCNEYIALKERLYVLDFDDLLIETYKVLKSGEFPEGFTHYSWIQVDEVQDLNPLQWAIVDLLAEPDATLVFFGDYEQSIYSFMGAKRELLDRKAESCKLHFFETNFRATSYLLDLLERYSFSTLKSNFPYVPFPARYESGQGHLRIMYHAGMGDVVHEVYRMLREKESTNVAILVQTNRQADEAEAAVQRKEEIVTRRGGVSFPYVKVSGFEFNKRKIYRDVAALMEVVANPLARVAWSRIVRHFAGKKYVSSQKRAQELVAEMFRLGIDPRDLLNRDTLFHEWALSSETYYDYAHNGRVVVFDTETTGLNLLEDHIVQLTGVEYIRGQPGRQLNLFLKAPDPMPPEAEAVHHISDAKLAEVGIDPIDGIRQFLEFVGHDLLIAHNLRFDKAMLINSCKRYGIEFDSDSIPMCDTLTLCRRLHPELTVYKLGRLLETFGLEGNNSHDALDDVLAAGNLFLKLADEGFERATLQRHWLAENQRLVDRLKRNAEDFFAEQKIRLEGRFDLRAELKEFISYSTEHGLYTRSDCLKMKNEALVGEAESSEDEGEEVQEEYTIDDLMRPLDKLFDYLEERYKDDPRSFRQVLEEDWQEIEKLKEADLYKDDAPLVISTIHKAKGRQFDTVIIPYCQESYFAFGNNVNGFPNLQVLIREQEAREAPNENLRKPIEEDALAMRDENARLLYVGMSRAKRNLVLATDCEEVSPYLSQCMECFSPGFKDFYSRIKANGGELYEFGEYDWFARLYYIIQCHKNNTPPPQLEKWLDDNVHSIRKIAYSILARCTAISDEEAEEILRNRLNRRVDLEEVINCIRQRKLEVFMDKLRFMSLADSTPGKLKATVISAIAEFLPSEKALDAFEDLVYDKFGPARVDAARRLAEHGRPQFAERVNGTDEDWVHLVDVVSDRAFKVISWRIERKFYGHELLTKFLTMLNAVKGQPCRR